MVKNEYVGKWRTEEMEAWDKEFIDLVVPGHPINGGVLPCRG